MSFGAMSDEGFSVHLWNKQVNGMDLRRDGYCGSGQFTIWFWLGWGEEGGGSFFFIFADAEEVPGDCRRSIHVTQCGVFILLRMDLDPGPLKAKWGDGGWELQGGVLKLV